MSHLKVTKFRARLELDRAAVLQKRAAFREAATAVDRARRIDPDSPEVWFHVGITMLSAEQPEQAIWWLNRAHDALGDQLALLFHLGQCCLTLGDDDTAVHWLRASMQHPEFPENAHKRFWVVKQLADALYRLGHARDAWAVDNWMLADETTEIGSEHTKALVLLRRGDYPNAWRMNEARRAMPDWRRQREYDVTQLPPDWDGRARGSVLYVAEQGYGDILQMARFLPEIAERSGEPVAVHAPPALASLLADMPGVGTVTRFREPWTPTRYSVLTMSAPFVFGTTLDTVPPPVAPLGRAWRDLGNAIPRVGLCWRGSETTKYTVDRSCYDHAALAALWTLPVEWVNLQHNEPVPNGAPFERVRFRDFAETADVMRGLDAVVTVDTSIVHLAGMLGVPTWLMPPTTPEWRWTLGERSPWYPDVRLFRRTRHHDWPDVLGRVAHDLLGHLTAAPHRAAVSHLALSGAA